MYRTLEAIFSLPTTLKCTDLLNGTVEMQIQFALT